MMTVECRKCSMNENCICIPSADECFVRKESYNKAIDDFADKMIIMMPGHKQDILQIAEQLKR